MNNSLMYRQKRLSAILRLESLGSTMITYDNLWKTMQEKGITKYALTAKYGLSPSLITRLKRNQSISIHTVDTLCSILKCSVSEIMEYKNDGE